MRSRLVIFAALLSAALSCHAAPPTPESIETLLTVTKVESMLNSVFANSEQMMRQSIQAASSGQTITAEQQRVLDQAPVQFVKTMREELTWDKLKPIYISIYQETLTQEEVDAMIAFYRTPAGASMVEKMPLLMQRSMQSMQTLIQPMLQKMRPAIEQAVRDAKVGG